jgi:hypothetical protein
MTIGRGTLEQSMGPLLSDLFVAARGSVTNQIVHPARGLNLFDVGCISADGRSLDELMQLVEGTRESCGWAILMIHGIGAGTHDLYLEAEVHDRFIRWLARQQRIWTAPVRTIAHYISICGFGGK